MRDASVGDSFTVHTSIEPSILCVCVWGGGGEGVCVVVCGWVRV